MFDTTHGFAFLLAYALREDSRSVDADHRNFVDLLPTEIPDWEPPPAPSGFQFMLKYDVVAVGSGVGSLASACLLAQKGYKVLVLEANYLPGGCCSSYWRKNWIFETGATTLMGFDPGQPLDTLQKQIGFDLKLQVLDPAMTVWIDDHKITRYANFDRWLEEITAACGQAEEQKRFWSLLHQLSDFVWKVSRRNLHFPIQSLGDLLSTALSNNPLDIFALRWAFRSTESVLRSMGLAYNEPFRRFIDQQLMITAQSSAADTPLLFAAPALCYTLYKNYYVPGGMIELPAALIAKLGEAGGSLHLREKVVRIQQKGKQNWEIKTDTGKTYTSRAVLSNLPIWNLPELTEGSVKDWTADKAKDYTDYWSAFTMGIVVDDTLPVDTTLHHQFILPKGQSLKHCGSHSVFLSISDRKDRLRCPVGQRVLAISTHAELPEQWFGLDKESYNIWKAETTEEILTVLEGKLPGFHRSRIRYSLDSSPQTWESWLSRHRGSVGGLPQRMGQLLTGLLGAKTPFPGFMLCGDTVYPGQGVPGVALGGIIAANRLGKYLKAHPVPPSAPS